jgi:hypothetical protein
MKKTILYLFSILLHLLLLILMSCQQNKRLYIKNPEEHIINELKNKRIIMLADYGHGMPCPKESLVSLLNKWLEKITNQQTQDHNIVLILEYDDQIVNLIKQFIETGNWEPVLNFCLPIGSLENLEFYNDLREFYLKVDSLNALPKYNSIITFDILGGEAFNVYNAPNKFLAKSKENAIRFFIDERDSLSSNKIISYLTKKTNKKAIIFYGGMHLIKKCINKDRENHLPFYESGYGYMLAYYLKKYFGDSKVLSINQNIFKTGKFKDTPFDGIEDTSLFIYSENMKYLDKNPDYFDACILRKEHIFAGHNVGYIFSRRTIESCINKMEFLQPFRPGFHAERYFNIAVTSLKLITGMDFDNINDWKNWYYNSNYNGFERLNSKDFAEQLGKKYVESENKTEVKGMLFSLGFGYKIMFRNEKISEDYWRDVMWENVLPQIKFFNAIGMLWFGYQDEKLKAENYLIAYTHKKYDEPSMYLKWWRHKATKSGELYLNYW